MAGCLVQDGAVRDAPLVGHGDTWSRNSIIRGKEQKKKRYICRHSPNRWVGGLGKFKKKL